MLLREPGAWTVKQWRRRQGHRVTRPGECAQASWRRPRRVAGGDPEEAHHGWGHRHRDIAARPEGAKILAEHEAHVNQLPWALVLPSFHRTRYY
jgi:hypothetical protein